MISVNGNYDHNRDSLSAKKTKRDMYTPLCIACYDNIPQLDCVSIDIAEFTGPRRINLAPAAAFGTCIAIIAIAKGPAVRLTRLEVAQCTADSLRIVSGPIGVGYSAPRSVEENFHTSFPLVGPADKAQVAVPELSGYYTTGNAYGRLSL